jgi:GR25 family glycosyltransferase involved in LPS biosynthesis
MNRHTLCLNMIVKNESHIILNTLKMLVSKLTFDHWVICDTGSTDNTCEIITTFFKEKQIPGTLYQDEWVDFSHNRNLALQRAFGLTDLLFIFDADDEIHGNITIPFENNCHGYLVNFGSNMGISYQRVLLINNRTKWIFRSVIHEYISCLEKNIIIGTIEGDYYVVSGKSGSRNKDPNKYLNDALILEKEYNIALAANDSIYNRYGFYCANSYRDAGNIQEAIKWYKIVLKNDNWSQEKYLACYFLYKLYTSTNEIHTALFYLIESLQYDRERFECIYELIQYYCIEDKISIAYMYYTLIKDFYENKYLNITYIDKLFIEPEKANFYLPYFMIIIASKANNMYPDANKTITKMYEIAFTKKAFVLNDFYIGNFLFNLQFSIDYSVKTSDQFITLFQSYINFLEDNNYELHKFKHFLINYEKYGITFKSFIDKSKFSNDVCKQSRKILFYVGHINIEWNQTYGQTNALGGSETAVINLSKAFPKNFQIYVSGSVIDEQIDNVTYINASKLRQFLEENAIHTIIVSRFVDFYEVYPEASFYQSFIWAHDVILISNYTPTLDVSTILKKWDDKIKGCVCQTEWHKQLFGHSYPTLTNKLFIINNGIDVSLFIDKPIKTTNRFLYTSATERGLERLLELWPSISEKLYDAELYICTYNTFPRNEEEQKLERKIKQYTNIKHLGKLTKPELYKLMATSEYWLYPTCFNETSCITAMEMLMSEVICLYYPIAGLANTLGNYGYPVEKDNEVNTILNLTTTNKQITRKNGKNYALSCSWEGRASNWTRLLFDNKRPKLPYEIKVINLTRRVDRKNSILKQFKEQSIENYSFFEAVDGATLDDNEDMITLFERNDFMYSKPVIGCTLSHLRLWKQLLDDDDHDFYVILEDDIHICPNFNTHLSTVCKIFSVNKLEHLSLSEYKTNKQFPPMDCSLYAYEKDVYLEGNTAFAYIISKPAIQKLFRYINTCSIKGACDNTQTFGNILSYCSLNYKLVDALNTQGTDIQINNPIKIKLTKQIEQKCLRISFCDWWESEYCGGTFDPENNFFTDLMRRYSNNYNVVLVSPNENPDVLFYSLFGYAHQQLNARRKVFFSGEPYEQRSDAHYNISFDKNSNTNTRLPLWVTYFTNNILIEDQQRKMGVYYFPNKERFCSFLASGPGLTDNRFEFVQKLSQYKQVDCGGRYLNNIGYEVPRGIECSGKIEHNAKYKFALAFESKMYPGYVTEKICDIFKSNTIPIYWGTKEVVKDFNPKSFINANDFANFDELINYIIKVDNDDTLYNEYFKQPRLSEMWYDILSDPNKIFFKNLADKIVGEYDNLLVKLM